MADYGTVAGVAARAPSLRVYSAQSPDVEQVERWLDEGAAWINRTLAAAGYAAPVSATAALYTELVGLTELYAAAMALRARGLDAATGLTEDRSGVWLREVRDRLRELGGQDLRALGATPATVTGPHRRMRSVQVRRIDGYSSAAEMGATEWSGVRPPSD